MRRILAVVVVPVLMGAIAACSHDGAVTRPEGPVSAVYDLSSLNGASLPYMQTIGGGSLKLTGDVLVLFANGSYSDTTYYENAFGHSIQKSASVERGMYKESGNTITFTNVSSGGTTYRGIRDESSLTQSVSTGTLVYRSR